MSGLPTLLRKGYVIPPPGSSKSEIERIKNTITIDYILNEIGSRIYLNKRIKNKPKSYGDRILVIKSDTGSGKSTVMPQKIFETFFDETRKNIAVTQPRILTAVDIPKIIASFSSKLKMDVNIGYNTGTFKRLPKEKGVIFSTVGVLSEQLKMWDSEKFMKRYQFIIIDEVHERDISTDTCLFLLKKLLMTNWENPECPLIILTSATFDENIFMNYFNVPSYNYIQVIGQTYPIHNHFSSFDIQNFIGYATDITKKIHLENPEDGKFRDILIFISSGVIGTQLYNNFNKFNNDIYKDSVQNVNLDIYKKGGADKQYVLPILLNKKNFTAGDVEYQNLFSNIKTTRVMVDKKFVVPFRRVIIATNIAETGLTIPTLRYCIDTGYRLSVEFQPDFGCNLIGVKNITKSSAIQRKGRVGRSAEGVWYPCYTEKTYNSYQDNMLSEILISNPIENILNILIKEKECEIIDSVEKESDSFIIHDTNSYYKFVNRYDTNIMSLDFIELPSISTLSYCMEKLYNLGFIDRHFNVDLLGFIANKIRFISLETIKMIFIGYRYKCSIHDLILMASFIYVKKSSLFKQEKIPQIDEIDFSKVNDELIYCLMLWKQFKKELGKKLHNSIKDPIKNTMDIENKHVLYIDKFNTLLRKYNFKFSSVLEIMSIKDQIIDNFITIGIDPYKYKDNYITLDNINNYKLCILDGYKDNLFIYKYTNNYEKVYQNFMMYMRLPSLWGKKVPQFITTTDYMIKSENGIGYNFTNTGFVSCHEIIDTELYRL